MEFDIESRNADILVILSITFLYSSGLPIMYPIAFICFFVTYWVDKYLLLSFYRRPIKFGKYLAKRTLGYYKFVLFLHIFGFLLMYGHTPILQNDLSKELGFTKSTNEVQKVNEEGANLFPVYLYLSFFVLIVFILWYVIYGIVLRYSL